MIVTQLLSENRRAALGMTFELADVEEGVAWTVWSRAASRIACSTSGLPGPSSVIRWHAALEGLRTLRSPAKQADYFRLRRRAR